MEHGMFDSYLVQRLERPFKQPVVDNPFTFGGGYKNGGLSDEAMEMLRGIFRFDYMGSAEFEFGAVPKALNEVSKHARAGELVAFDMKILLSAVAPDWRDKTKPPRGAHGQVYVLCHTDWAEEVMVRIAKMAKEGFRYRSKEATNLDRALRPNPDPTAYKSAVCGWLELDNGYLFFTDREMWAKTAALFGVDVEVSA